MPAGITLIQVMPLQLSRRRQVFHKINVLKNFSKFTGKHLCYGLFFNRVANFHYITLLKMRLRRSRFSVNFEKFYGIISVYCFLNSSIFGKKLIVKLFLLKIIKFPKTTTRSIFLFETSRLNKIVLCCSVYSNRTAVVQESLNSISWQGQILLMTFRRFVKMKNSEKVRGRK